MPADPENSPPINDIRLAIKSLLPDGHPTLKVVAAELFVSTRTLQRRLSLSGLTYSELVRQVRHERACQLLEHSTASIQQIASRTGFANPSGFSRAFHAWTGLSPSDYRRRCPSQ